MNGAGRAVARVQIVEQAFLIICQPPCLAVLYFLRELGEHLLHVDPVSPIQRDDWDRPETRVPCRVLKELVLVYGCSEDGPSGIARLSSIIGPANPVCIVRQEALQPSDILLKRAVEFADLCDRKPDGSNKGVLVGRVHVVTELNHAIG